MTTNLQCPWCKTGKLSIVTDGLIGRPYLPPYHVVGRPLPIKLEPKPFAACNACEFCLEIRPELKTR